MTTKTVAIRDEALHQALVTIKKEKGFSTIEQAIKHLYERSLEQH